MSTTKIPSRARRLVALVVALLLVLAACGGGDDSGTNFDEIGRDLGDGDSGAASTRAPATTAAASAEADDRADRQRTDAAGDGEELGSGGIEPLVQQTDFGRQIIYTADLTVAVTDVAAAGQQATRIIGDLGGILFGQETEGLPEPHSVLIFKVEPDRFQEALAALGDIGEVRTQNVSADDVTERVVDLQSRIETAEASVERLRGFLENAVTIEDIAELEGQLVQRESDLESMRGQLRTLEDRVALATITLTLTEAFANPQVRLFASVYSGDDGGVSCPGAESATVDEGNPAVLCFEIRNNGDTVLTDFTLDDSVLELELADLDVIDGDPEGDLRPGQSMILATQVEPERRIRTQTTVEAIPVNEDGTAIEARKVSSVGNVVIGVDEPEGLPGFDDGIRVAVSILRWLGGMFVIAAGLIVPFLWLIPLIALWWWWRRRRKQKADADAAAAPVFDVSHAQPDDVEAAEDATAAEATGNDTADD